METTPFLWPLPNEIALFAIRNLLGYDLLRLKEVDRRAHRLVIELFSQQGYWRWLGFTVGKEPTQPQLGRAFSLVKCAGPRPSILNIPASTSPFSWKIIRRLNLASQGSQLDLQQVAKRAASFGDAGLCRRVIQSGNFSNVSECMMNAIRGGHLDVVEMFLAMGVSASSECFSRAIREGQIAIAQCLTAHNPDLLREISKLRWAAFCGKTEDIHQIVSRKRVRSSEALKGDNGLPSPLHFAAYSGQVGAIAVLYSLGANIEETRDFEVTALHSAAMNGHTEAIQELVDLGCSIKATDFERLTALHYAAWYGQIRAIIKLVSLGCPIDATDLHGQTAFHWAAREGHTEAIDTLADLGCSIEAIDRRKQTALHKAALGGHTDAIKVLIKRGCPVDAVDYPQSQTALHKAAKNGHSLALRQLVKLKCCIDATDLLAHTALHSASMNGHADAIRELVTLGCPIQATDFEGLTALHDAAMHGYAHAVSVLADLECAMETTDRKGLTALHWAAKYGHTEVIQELVDLGCPIDATDHQGQTALQKAARYGYMDAIKECLRLGASLPREVSKFTREEINQLLEEAKKEITAHNLCIKYGISTSTFYIWKALYDNSERVVPKVKRHKSS